MALATTDITLVGQMLEEDVFTHNGTLLLTQGTMLTSTHIYTLLRQKVFYVRVAERTEPDQAKSASIFAQLQESALDRETLACYIKAMEGTKHLFQQVQEDFVPPLEHFSKAFYPIADQVLKQVGIFRSLYVLEGSESYTYRHSINVGILSSLIARLMKKPEEEVLQIGIGGFMHDLGKMLVPKDILMKPGKLSAEEFEVMKLHTVHGYDLIMKMDEGCHLLAECALLHHERLDGSGYPQQRTASTIPLECQILAVADMFDAICSDRIYKSRTSPFEAAQYLWKAACDGGLNIEIVTLFVHYIAMLYVGARARLNTGEEIEIILIHKDEPMRPLVRRHSEFVDLRFNRHLTIEKMIG
jgi:HD-GYP domain-containing protein (c-di-GMP phosphodiesterase class II)